MRLRVVNTDTARVYKLDLSATEAKIIAWDGHPTQDSITLPTAAKPLLVGPGQRVDVALRMPKHEGQLITKLPGQPKAIASLQAIGTTQNRSLRALSALSPNPVAAPNLRTAQTHEFVFGWSPDESTPNNGICGSLGYTFWSINRIPWAGDATKGTGLLATLERGQS